MLELIIRTEDMRLEDVKELFVETKKDREVIIALKGQSPVILVGSRGVGKSFLLRIAQSEMLDSFEQEKILPVYISFNRGSLVQTNDPLQFQHWMLAKVCQAIHRAMKIQGLLVNASQDNIAIFEGKQGNAISELIDKFENSWRKTNENIDTSLLPSIENFKYAVEDICEELGIKRLCLMFDEAIHVFIPEQQRQFFTLFRDLRTPYVSCNAAVYPGVTSYGDTFQASHDATMISIDRDAFDKNYVASMWEIIEKQATKKKESAILTHVSKNRDNFKVLAFAANGNPRILLKLVTKADNMSSTKVNAAIKEYFRTDIWVEHSNLAGIYSGHQIFFDWGRNFVEDIVLPDLKSKNDIAIEKGDSETRCSIWIQRGAPEAVNIALRLLDYTGILTEHTKGIRATRAELGTRFLVNLGCLFALEANPNTDSLPIIGKLSIKRMSEYGTNHSSYAPLTNSKDVLAPIDPASIIQKKISQSVDILDLSEWMKAQLRGRGIETVKQLLDVTEEDLKQIKYIGDVRSRQAMNAAVSAMDEYLSG